MGNFQWLTFLILALASRQLQSADISTNHIPRTGLVPAERTPKPFIARASNEAELRIKQFKTPPGFKTELFAAEPMLANPVAFCLDEEGRIFVAETHRYRSSVLDVRHYPHLWEDDLASRSVDDRTRLVKKHFGQQSDDLAIESEIVRLLEDRDKDGRADFSAVYADGFNTVLDGIASGLIVRKKKLWFTNIPELWLLEGMDEKGYHKSKTSLSHGYGVHFGITGHDMHGLAFGPDGKLYFSFGDRGANVKTREGKGLNFPDEGAVFRCRLDGTGMEVFATGLRNPQELAFDNYGNLFTGENDSDQGDVERWVYLVEGGDSGWRNGYQIHPLGNGGPWNFEKLWMPRFPGQAAYIIPPVTNILDGPSGLVFNSSAAFSSRYQNHFFLCYFKGTSTKSSIHSYQVEQEGAGFRLINGAPFIENCLPTDVDFGWNGKLYFSDWHEGWPKSNKGRIYSISNTANPNVQESKKTSELMAKGLHILNLEELIALLEYPDQRVRLAAQYELAEKGTRIVGPLTKVARTGKNQLARLHAIWCLVMIQTQSVPDSAIQESMALSALVPLLRDQDPEIRAQTAKAVGEGRVARGFRDLLNLLKDPSPRVRYFAIQALGSFKLKEAVQPILMVLKENEDKDLYIRHACVMALTKCGDRASLVPLARHGSRPVRMAALLAMRRMALPEISHFLSDTDPLIVVEAARAINDVPIQEALPELAAFLSKIAPASNQESGQTLTAHQQSLRHQSVMFRLINANFRTGRMSNARRLADLALRENEAEVFRIEALQALATWMKPHQRDRIVGVYRPLTDRDIQPPTEAARLILTNLSQIGSEAVMAEAIKTFKQLNLKESAGTLFNLAMTRSYPPRARIEALKALSRFNHPRVLEATRFALNDPNKDLHNEAVALQAILQPSDAVDLLLVSLESGSIQDKQLALRTLGEVKDEKADIVLARWIDRISEPTFEKELLVDILEASGKRTNNLIQKKVADYYNAVPTNEVLTTFKPALVGGNAGEGRKIFIERPEVSCLRCHKINGAGGDVGPAIDGIGSRLSRDYMLESIVLPNAHISPGYENVIVTLKDDKSFAGTVKSETETELVINTPEEGAVTVQKKEIQNRAGGLSAMPDGMGSILTLRELRDLVEFLAQQK